MNSNAIRYIVAVADTHSTSLAAKAMFVSQPTISQSIQVVEKQLGVRLFDRTTIPLTLTREGKIYTDWAREILLTHSQLQRQIAANAARERDCLSIGIAPHRSAMLLPDILSSLSAEFPDAVFPIRTAIVSDLYQALDAQDVDIIVSDAPENPQRYNSLKMMSEKVLLGVPDKWAVPGIAGKESNKFPTVSLSAFSDVPFVSFAVDTYLGKSLRMLCELHDFSPREIAEVSTVDTAHLLASRGLGVTLLPEFTVLYGNRQPGIHYYYIDRFSPERQLTIVYKKNKEVTPLMKRFIELFSRRYGS